MVDNGINKVSHSRIAKTNLTLQKHDLDARTSPHPIFSCHSCNNCNLHLPTSALEVK